jgi:hypothetical protein
LFGHRRAPWIALGCAIFLSIALGAQRLAAALAFIDQFPRAEYVLPGFPNPLDALQMALVSLFWRPPAFVAQSRMLGSQWRPELHEWAFGVGPAALLLLLAGAWVLAREHAAKGGAPRRSADRVAVWVAVVALLAVPIALNWHHPTWTGFLKELPVFRSSSSLVRWFAAYIPLVALLSGLALDRVATAGGLRRVIALLVVLTTVAWNAWIDLVGPDSMTYNAAPVDRAWRAARATGDVPAVTRIALSASGPREMPLNRNDSMIDGASQLSCYQPMFGYRLERMPVGVLRPGPALAEAADGVLNVKNPACYVFPLENRCVPGDHFATAQRAEAERFLQYEPFEFVSGALQSVADAVTLGTLALLLIAALLGALSAVAKRWSH